MQNLLISPLGSQGISPHLVWWGAAEEGTHGQDHPAWQPSLCPAVKRGAWKGGHGGAEGSPRPCSFPGWSWDLQLCRCSSLNLLLRTSAVILAAAQNNNDNGGEEEVQSSSPSCHERDDPKRAVPTRWVQATTDGTHRGSWPALCVRARVCKPSGAPFSPRLSVCLQSPP